MIEEIINQFKELERPNKTEKLKSFFKVFPEGYGYDKDKSILYDLANSNNLWKQRISILSTFYFIKQNQFEDTLKILELFLNHTHDLIHKAVGWMLREIGNRNKKIEDDFLKKHYKIMPRTMLRYAIEKYPEEERQKYLKGKI